MGDEAFLRARVFELRDVSGERLGDIVAKRREGDRLLGEFAAAAAFARHAPLFERFESLVNDQIFALAYEAGAEIESSGFYVVHEKGKSKVHDLQIMSGGVSFFLGAPVSTTP